MVMADDAAELRRRLENKQPLVDPNIFTVLRDAKASPQRRSAHNKITAVARENTESASCDATFALLQTILEHMHGGFKHYFRQHLANGRLHPSNTSRELKQMLFLISSHNILAEELFGQLDQWFSSRTQSAGLSTASATILAKKNGTLEWFYGLTPEDRALFLAAAADPERQQVIVDTERSQATAARTHRTDATAAAIDSAAAKREAKASDLAAAFRLELFTSPGAVDAGLGAMPNKTSRLKLVKQHLKAYKLMYGVGRNATPKTVHAGYISETTGKPLWIAGQLKLPELVSNLKLLVARWKGAAEPDNFATAVYGPTFMPVDSRQPAAVPVPADSVGKQRLVKLLANLQQAGKKADKMVHSIDPVQRPESDPAVDPAADAETGLRTGPGMGHELPTSSE